MPKISCLMANYNTNVNYLKIAVESILSQTFKDFELIIVDDCSSDEKSYELLREYEKADARIKLVRNTENKGLPYSLNGALSIASGEYIARMDTDDRSFPDRFEKQLEYIEQNSLDLIGSGTNRMDENGEIFIRNSNESYPSDVIAKLTTVVTCIPHPTWFAKKTVYDKLSGYRNIHCCEDYDFLLRALSAGFKLGIANQTLLDYRFNLQSISRKNALKQLLTSCYLSENLNRINEITVDEIAIYLNNRLTVRAADKYASAVRLYELFNAEMRKNKIKAAYYLLKATFKSKYILKNVNRSARVYKIKRIAKKQNDV